MSNTTNPPPIPEEFSAQAKDYADQQFKVTDEKEACREGAHWAFRHLSPTGESAGRWVRGDERQPPVSEDVPLLINLGDVDSYGVGHFTGEDFKDESTGWLHPLAKVKWLDESPSQPSAGMEWISVKDKLPPKFKNVLCLSNRGQHAISCVDASGKIDDFHLEVENGAEFWTHWHYFPPAPTPTKTTKGQ